MELAWRRVREVAGDNCIFEGTIGLPATLTQRLNQQGLKLALSEQFSGGLINPQLQSEGRRWQEESCCRRTVSKRWKRRWRAPARWRN